MKRLAAIALALLAVLAAASPVAWAQAPQGGAGVSRSVTLYVPAVTDTGKGDVIEVTVTLTFPGNGSVKVENDGGSVGATTVNSARMAFLTASALLGVDWNTLDLSVHFHSRGTLEGPSGSFAIALAVAALLLPLPVEDAFKGYAITGAVSPDGLDSSVGGVPEKCRAAEERGLTLLYPMANKADASSCSGARPLTGLLSGLRLLANYSAPLRVDVEMGYPEAYAEVMAREAVKMAEYAKGNLTEASRMASVPREVYEQIEGLASRALDLAGDKPYSAASLAFTALYKALALRMQAELRDASEVAEFISSVESKVDELEGSMAASPASWQAAELLSVAYTRLADAKSAVLKAKTLLRDGLNDNATSEASYALARLESVRTWIKAAEAVNGTGALVDRGALRLLAARLLEYSGVAVNYSASLLESIGRENPFTSRDVEAAINIIDYIHSRGVKEFEAGDYVSAIGYLRQALSEASYYIFYFSASREAPDVLNEYVNELENVIEALATVNALRGVYSVLAPSYVEYAGVLLSDGDVLSAVRVLEAAVFSLVITRMLTLCTPSYLAPKAAGLGGPRHPGAGGAPQPGLPRAAEAVALAALAFVAGYAAGVAGRVSRVEEAVLSRL
ncbi:S16 family serine protease [Stetteria hydrogenophila]